MNTECSIVHKHFHLHPSILVLEPVEGFFHLSMPHLNGHSWDWGKKCLTWPWPCQHSHLGLHSLFTHSLRASSAPDTWLAGGTLLRKCNGDGWLKTELMLSCRTTESLNNPGDWLWSFSSLLWVTAEVSIRVTGQLSPDSSVTWEEVALWLDCLEIPCLFLLPPWVTEEL